MYMYCNRAIDAHEAVFRANAFQAHQKHGGGARGNEHASAVAPAASLRRFAIDPRRGGATTTCVGHSRVWTTATRARAPRYQ